MVNLLIKVACCVNYLNNVGNIKSSRFKLVSTRRSTVLSQSSHNHIIFKWKLIFLAGTKIGAKNLEQNNWRENFGRKKIGGTNSARTIWRENFCGKKLAREYLARKFWRENDFLGPILLDVFFFNFSLNEFQFFFGLPWLGIKPGIF